MPSLARFALEDQVVVVTGAGRGIGRVIAKEAAQSGAKIAIGSRSTDELESLTAELVANGSECMHHVLDVSKVASIQTYMDAVIAHYGRIDVLINNAGYNKLAKILDYDEETYDRIVDANLKNVFFCCQIVARQMIKQAGGSIVNISSQAGVVGAPERGPYSGAKAGVNNLTRTMAAEWAEFGIRVNAVAPTVTRSPLAEQAMKDSPALREAVRTKNLLRRDLAEPEEISAPVIFMASPAASMITGHTLVVDGGWTMV
ncbi:MAG: NAD(P)-dependent dehydrogenase (short-subunit alcohol dehydrogenase family) [Gammaproteobacteria bacterium]|jgi:NAD(P)-dependent dehydrogenase (short-subunit alcohol dehydrogenase family)